MREREGERGGEGGSERVRGERGGGRVGGVREREGKGEKRHEREGGGGRAG